MADWMFYLDCGDDLTSTSKERGSSECHFFSTWRTCLTVWTALSRNLGVSFKTSSKTQLAQERCERSVFEIMTKCRHCLVSRIHKQTQCRFFLVNWNHAILHKNKACACTDHKNVIININPYSGRITTLLY